MPLQLPCIGLRFDRNTRLQDDRQMTLGRRHMAWLMRFEAHSAKQDGGEDGIRTHEKLLTSTPLAGERLRPLGHLSVAPLDKEKRRHNQQAGAIISEKSADRRARAASGGDSAAIAWRSTQLPAAFRSVLCRIRADSAGTRTSMVNESFRSEAKSCHLCNNPGG